MVITHETTIEQYEAWLATNPSFSEFKAAVREVFKMAYRAIGRVRRIIKDKKRSCLAAVSCQVTMPLDYNRNAIGTRREGAAFEEWRAGIWRARIAIRRHIERHEMMDVLSESAWRGRIYFEQVSRVDEEIAMEQLHAEALEILVKN